MALFQKKPQVSDSLPLYTLGSEKTVLVVGLGNPGEKYAGTRHNVGFEVADLFAKLNDFPAGTTKKDLKAEVCINNIAGTRVILAKPTTYMNSGGQAVQAVQQFYKVANSQTLVVYDELAIPFGQIRTRVGGSNAGHNGVKSLIDHLGEDFCRLRIGIGQVDRRSKDADFVLAKFSKTEQSDLSAILREASAIITEFIAAGQLPHDTRKVL